MSVVNKMLQDLEARQSHADEITADYHPPQQKQSSLLVWGLLVFAISAIAFALIDKNLLFSESHNTKANASVPLQTLPIATPKMTAAPNKVEQKQVAIQQVEIQQIDEQHESLPEHHTSVEPIEKITGSVLPNKVITDKPSIQSEQSASNDSIKPRVVTQDIQHDAPNNIKLNTQTDKKKTSNFSMSGTSQKTNISDLKQRIADNLSNKNIDMALPLLHQLLEAEPENITTRKKLASLLFARGNYSQTKQLLIQGIEMHPAESDLRLMLARLYVVQKETLQAMTVLAEFQPTLDNKTEYLAYRATLAQQLKQTTLAKSDYQTLTTIEPANAKWWLGLAIAEDQLGEIDVAIYAYNKAGSLGQLSAKVNEFIQQRTSILAGAQ